MKTNLMVVVISLFTLLSCRAQQPQVPQELFGKWRLTKWEYNGQEVNIKSFFKTDEVYQVFKKDNNFESIIGDSIYVGKWKLSSDAKSLTVIPAKEPEMMFEVEELTADRRILNCPAGRLYYLKVK